MQKKRRLIPFSWLPASWGLKGKVFEQAAAHYYYEGRDLALKLVEIEHRDDPKALNLATLAIKAQHDEITALQHDVMVAELEHTDPVARKKALLDVRCKHGEITEFDHAMEILKLTTDAKKFPHEYRRGELKLKLDHGYVDSYAYACGILSVLRDELAKTEMPMDRVAYDLEQLAIDFEHGKLTAYDCDTKQVAIEHPVKDSAERQLAQLDVDLKHDKINQHDYDKKVATLKEEPWIGIIDQGFDPDKGINGVYFEFDWNEYWIIFLRLNGYYGNTEEQVVDMWFADVCRAQGVGAMQGLDDGSVIPFNGRIVNRPPEPR